MATARGHENDAEISAHTTDAKAVSNSVRVRDLSAVRKSIQKRMYSHGHDDGSFAPLLIRFAWHCCGTYDKNDGSGGSNGCTIRFDCEKNDPENAGFEKVLALLEEVHKEHSFMSYADLYILAGYVALECAGFINGLKQGDVTVLVRSVPLRGFDR